MRPALLASSLVALACADSVRAPDGPADAAPRDGDPSADAAACDADSTLACAPRDPACGARFVAGVQGIVLDAAGAPVAGARPQLCARLSPDHRLVCLAPPVADANGRFFVEVPPEVRCLDSAAMRTLLPGSTFATSYCHLDLGPDTSRIAVLSPLILHDTGAPALPPRGDGTVRDVVFPGGLVLALRPEDVGGDGYEALRAARVPIADGEPCIAGASALAAYALAPEGPIEGGAAIGIDDGLGLAPGTVVDLAIAGGLQTRLLDGTPVPEADLASIGIGTVSEDGTRIETSARLPYLSWLVVRR